MNYRKQCLLALLVICMSGSVAAAKAAHPLAGTYVYPDGWWATVVLEISNRGSLSGHWGDYWIAGGHISEEGYLSMILRTNGKRFTDRIKVIGELWLNESGDLVGYVQFEGMEPQEVLLFRQ